MVTGVLHLNFVATAALRSLSAGEPREPELIATLVQVTLIFGVVILSVLVAGFFLVLRRKFAGRALLACGGLLAIVYVPSELIIILLWEPDRYGVILLAMASPGAALFIMTAVAKFGRWVWEKDRPEEMPALLLS